MLRCAQIGISISELENITLGMAYEIMSDYNNEYYNYPYIATQEDMDKL